MTDGMTVLAADIGGSSVKAALVSSAGAVVHKRCTVSSGTGPEVSS